MICTILLRDQSGSTHQGGVITLTLVDCKRATVLGKIMLDLKKFVKIPIALRFGLKCSGGWVAKIQMRSNAMGGVLPGQI